MRGVLEESLCDLISKIVIKKLLIINLCGKNKLHMLS